MSKSTESPTASQGKLKPNTIGLVGVVFMVVAFSAPVSAMSGNVPVAVGFGNGTGAPAGFLVATVVLTIFSFGFTALAKHITSAGAFYTFVSRGLGKPFGLSAGFLSMLSYMVMEAGLVGLFAAFCDLTFKNRLGIDLPWIVYAIAVVIVISLLSYRDVGLASKVLSGVLIGEIALLSAMAFSVLFHGGGPDGLMPESLNPISAFSTNGLASGSVGVGLLFAFWSWVGFESTAIYGEESRDPKRVIPAATLIAVIGIGVFYAFISWSIVAGNGAAGAVERATSANPFDLIYYSMETYLGSWSVGAMEWCMILGSFACALAIHNSATRYLYAIGRDGILPRVLGKPHPVHQSPHIASVVQSCFTAVLLIVSFSAGVDPYGELFVLVAFFATISFLTAQMLTSIAAINYFHVQGNHPETASWWRTFLAPIVGGGGMGVVIWLLLTNYDVAAGPAAATTVGRLLPWSIVAVLLLGLLLALYWRKAKPEIYERIGSTVYEVRTEEPLPGAPVGAIDTGMEYEGR
ncbi:APC family permease [Paeniglutamicibacter sp. NPDC091659]|uniref:APC family permease n=1 Tax=Paeniglutamicibacter sp. NPDC091659 TaxID=3364389 RepID=UPI00382417E7